MSRHAGYVSDGSMVRLGGLVVAVAMTAGLSPSIAVARPAYRQTAAVPLSAPDRWDYLVADAKGGRVYVAHGDRLDVIDARALKLVGSVSGIAGGPHGTSISHATGQGFTDDGRAGMIVAFDLRSLKVVRTIPADQDADGIAADPATGSVFVVEGDPASITVADPRTDAPVATIKAGEKLEYPVADGRGSIYIAGEERGDLVRVDARANRVIAHWPAPGCRSPHGLAYDDAGRRLFMGCANAVMAVMDADTGRMVATLPIGRGNDAVAWDPIRRRAFSSNGIDGTVTVYQRTAVDRYRALEPIRTAVSGRTMTIDESTGRLFVAAADTTPNPTPGGRPRPVPGTLRVLVFDPIP